MILKNIRQLENTRAKLTMLKEAYESALQRPMANETVRAFTLRSLKRLINQLEEEIAEFEAHQPTAR